MTVAVVCRHHEEIVIIDRKIIGVCADCGQRKQYDIDGRNLQLLKRGRLKGRWTLVHAPRLEVKCGVPS